jgi:phosphate/sulfate permease
MSKGRPMSVIVIAVILTAIMVNFTNGLHDTAGVMATTKTP